MTGGEISWLALSRKVPPTIRVAGVDRLWAALVLDVDTGLVRGIAIETSQRRALQQAFTTALTQPVGDLPPGAPSRTFCAPGLAGPARSALAASAPAMAAPIIEVQPGPEAEDIFDSFLGHMAGRAQPEEPPTPDDWWSLIARTGDFRKAEPWTRWSDEQDLLIDLRRPDGGVEQHCAVVLGQAGVQHGLVLYPGDELPAGLRDEPPADLADRRTPAGTLMLTLDAPDEPPAELTAKAIRYGWPPTDDLVPVFMAITDNGAEEIGRPDAQRLTAGLAAVVALDRRGPTLADAADVPITGTVTLADQHPIGFAIRHRPTRGEAQGPALRLHLAGNDLLPAGTPVTLGHLGWQALPDLRAAARLHRPAPADAPAPAGKELPLLVVSPDPPHGPRVAATIAQLDPYGVSAVDTDDGQSVLVLAGANGAEMLMMLPSDHAALRAFRRRLRQTKGRHVVLVADASSATGVGTVYGIVECHQPPEPDPRPPASGSRARRSSSRGSRRGSR